MAESVVNHSEKDVEFAEVGNLHFEDGKLIIADVDVAKMVAAMAGVLQGGRQRGLLEVYVAKSDSDGTLGGYFAEPSEPKG
jgi:hypothetical protein